LKTQGQGGGGGGVDENKWLSREKREWCTILLSIIQIAHWKELLFLAHHTLPIMREGNAHTPLVVSEETKRKQSTLQASKTCRFILSPVLEGFEQRIRSNALTLKRPIPLLILLTPLPQLSLMRKRATGP